MQIENLKENMIIKNYKELCSILGIQVQAGNTKKSQLKEIERFVKLEKQGNKFLIKEVYEEPLKKIDLRENNKGGNNDIYTDDFREIMLFLLQNIEEKTLLVSKTKLIKMLQLVNKNYFTYKDNVRDLKQKINVDEDMIYDFYDTTQIKLDSLIRRNLQKMSNETLIVFQEVICIAKYKTIIARNQKGEVVVDNGNILSDVKLEYREANEEELEIIMKSEYKILEELELQNKQEVFLKGKWKDFKYRVEELLKVHNIKFYYKAYKITKNVTALKNIDINNHLDRLNYNLINSINCGANKRHLKAIDDISNVTNVFKLEKCYMREKNEYIKNMKLLTDYLIDRNVIDIVTDEEVIEELEKEFEDFHSYVIGG